MSNDQSIGMDEQSLWRYADVSSVLWTLQRRQLFFNYPENFEDKYEGQYPASFIRSLQGESDDAKHNRRFFAQMAVPTIAVSCWHAHDRESSAMWRAYGGNGGLAIRTTTSRLRAALPPDVRIEPIRYIDFETDSYEGPHMNMFDRVMYKRHEFSHEREYRCMISAEPHFSDPTSFDELGAAGLAVRVDLSKLIAEIVVGPQIADWFTDSLISIVKAQGLEVPVRASALAPKAQTLYRATPVTILTRWDNDNHLRIPRLMFGDDMPGAKPNADEPLEE